MSIAIEAVERGFVPDSLVRSGIRSRLRKILKELEQTRDSVTDPSGRFLLARSKEPVALSAERANEQHYGLPVSFFRAFLGNRAKYSCCLWEKAKTSLDQAEEAMLALTCSRAGIENGHSVMDLGCGWGSLSFYLAQNYPDSNILAISNSKGQIDYINRSAREKHFKNLRAVLGDVSEYEPSPKFDRIVSVEMLEHIRNWDVLFRRIALWLKNDGRFFCHFFCHRDIPYLFRSDTEDYWMGHFFFTGGSMPSFSLPARINKNLLVESSWKVNGSHYSRTLESWLVNLDGRKREILPILEEHYGKGNSCLWYRRWRIFLLACSELFSYNSGNEWFIAHHLMKAADNN